MSPREFSKKKKKGKSCEKYELKGEELGLFKHGLGLKI
jgi:hypothetical protein